MEHFPLRLVLKVNDNGEFSLGRKGFKGVEYYNRESLVERLSQLRALGVTFTFAVLYVNESDAYYLPNSDVVSQIEAFLQENGALSVQEFR